MSITDFFKNSRNQLAQTGLVRKLLTIHATLFGVASVLFVIGFYLIHRTQGLSKWEFVGSVLLEFGILVFVVTSFEVFTQQKIARLFGEEVFKTIYANEDAIDNVVTPEMVTRFFIAALTKRLMSKENAEAIYSNVIEPYLSREKQFRPSWSYAARLRKPAKDIQVGEGLELNKDDYYHMTIEYEFTEHSANPGIAFTGGEATIQFAMSMQRLQESFAAANCIYREVLFLKQDDEERIIKSLVKQRPNAGKFAREVGRALFGVSVEVNGSRAILDVKGPDCDSALQCFTWKLQLPQMDGITDRHFRLTVALYIRRENGYLPIVISRPTRAPRVEFEYTDTDIKRVDSFELLTGKAIFQAPPVDQPLTGRTLKRMIFQLSEDEWIFPASGIVIFWQR